MNINSGSGKKGKQHIKDLFTPTPKALAMLNSYDAIVELEKVLFTERIGMVKTGLTKEQLVTLKEIFDLDYDTLSEMLNVTNRSLHLRKGTDVLSRNVSDRLMAIVHVYSTGYNVFGDRELFHRWLKLPSEAFAGEPPISLLDTFVGMDEVRSELLRLRDFVL